VRLALGHTDMRKGMDGLATLVQETLKKDPFSGHFCLSRQEGEHPEDSVLGRQRAVSVQQAIDRGAFVWPRMYVPGGALSAQLAMLIEGIDWRSPERVWRGAISG
jgi:transposase